jgi:putative NADPH-quinone reductase
MNASIILAHPYEKSFNHAIFHTAENAFKNLNINVYAHDLYKEGFNPVLTTKELGKEKTDNDLVNQYVDEMLQSRILVFIHPNWWGQPPAIMKGYIDRIFRPPYAYDYDENNEGNSGIPKLTGKVGIVFNTGNTEAKREEEVFHDPLENEWIQCVFSFCGIENHYRRLFRVIANSNDIQRKEWLR